MRGPEAYEEGRPSWVDLATSDLEAAQGYLERSYALDPEQPDVLGTLGTIHVNRGNHAGAVDLLEKAVEGASDNANYQWALFLAALEVGRLERAEKALHDLHVLQPQADLSFGIEQFKAKAGRAPKLDP